MNERIEARREASQKAEERRKIESGSIEQVRVAESRQEKKAGKEKQKIDRRRQSQIKLHETCNNLTITNRMSSTTKTEMVAETQPGNRDKEDNAEKGRSLSSRRVTLKFMSITRMMMRNMSKTRRALKLKKRKIQNQKIIKRKKLKRMKRS